MSLLGMGTDLVEVDRISRLLGQHPERFLERCFRPKDVGCIDPNDPEFPLKVAGSWAAKEAFLKALGLDVGAIPYRDIELVPSPSGALTLNLYGLAGEMSSKVGAGSIRVSISHTSSAAVALVVLGP